MKKLLFIALTLGFLNANSQSIINPTGINGESGLTEAVSHFELRVKNESGPTQIIVGVGLQEAVTALPSGSYEIEIVYVSNNRRRIDYQK